MDTTYKETLISKLSRMLKWVEPDEIEEILSQTKFRLSENAALASQSDIEEFFDKQIFCLVKFNIPEEIINMLQDQRNAVIRTAAEMKFEEGHLYFLPVIPWAKARNIRPYYIFDVEDGSTVRSYSREDARKLITRQGRIELADLELIALSLHTDVFARNRVDVFGHSYCTNNAPYTCINVDRSGFPCRFFFDCAIDHCGIPSRRQI